VSSIPPPSCWALLLAIALGATPALAADDDARAKATALVKEGAHRYLAKDYAGALSLFQQGYQAYPSPRIEFDVAQCLHHLDRPEDAATTYQSYLDDAVNDPAVDASSVAAARQALDELDTRVFRVVVATTPEDAHLEIDGRVVRAGRAFVARAAPHTLRVSAAGYQSRSVPLQAPASGPLRLAVALTAQAPASADLLPPPPAPLAPGELASPMVAAPVSHAPSWVAWGIGGALAAGGAIAGVLALQSANAITARGHSCPSASPDDASCGTWQAQATAADILFGGAVVAGGVGAVLWFTAGPGPTAGSAQATVAGRF
jgi:hypothetical protein